MTSFALPALSAEGGLRRYLREIKNFPMLEREEEYMLARRYHDRDDVAAAHKLVTSHLRLVAKIAMGYRGYGLPVADLISEGNVGLMRAVKGFDPERGFRLSTYALWWIKASITEYVLRSWSMVKIGTVAAQKKLFFGLRRMKERLSIMDNGELSPDEARRVAEALNVGESEAIEMNRRLVGGDFSLNAPVLADEDKLEYQDLLADNAASPESHMAESEESEQRHKMLYAALDVLNARERDIVLKRQLSEEACTLEALAETYGVSRERIRQIESRALEKLSSAVLEKAAAARGVAEI